MGVPKQLLYSYYGQEHRMQLSTAQDYISWHNEGPPHALKFTAVFVCPLTAECFWSGLYPNPRFVHNNAATGKAVVQQLAIASGTNSGGGNDARDNRSDNISVSTKSSSTSVSMASTSNDDSMIQVVWYPKKVMAEHAAAARAYDCWQYRDYCDRKQQQQQQDGVAPPLYQFCVAGQDLPYLKSDAPKNLYHHAPQLLPPQVFQAISLGQDRVHRRLMASAGGGSAGGASTTTTMSATAPNSDAADDAYKQAYQEQRQRQPPF